MAEPHDRKPILTIEQQIEHLKQKGVAFELCSEEEAADYLRDKCNFFKLASYRKLFSKYEGGPRDGRYVDLDFGQLRLLAALDQELRHALLGMTLDIEHFQKVTLLREMEDRGEDGYAIVADYMASLTTANREYRLRELKMSGRSPYSSSLYAKYSGDMPAWAFLELTSFGTLIDFVRFCARRWGDRRLEASHYDLKRVKSVRNCAAHGSCLINCFAERGAARTTSGKCQRHRGFGVDGGGVIERHGGLARPHQQGDFGATQDHRLGTGLCQIGDDGQILGLRRLANIAEAELVIDDAVHPLPCSVIRHQHLQPEALLEPPLVEILLHGEAGAEQAYPGHPVGLEAMGRGIGDVEQGNVDGGLDLRRHLVHGVGPDQQEIGATGLDGPGLGRQQTGGGGPVTGMLQPLYLGKIDAIEQHPRRMQAAEPRPHTPVERLVVADGGLPAHATQQTDTFHEPSLPPLWHRAARASCRAANETKKAPKGQQDSR